MKNHAPAKKGQRAAPRTPTEATVTCRPYTSSGAVHATDGVVRNFSIDGSYIETSRPYPSGTILLMRMLRYPPGPPDPGGEGGLRSICLAEVKWQQILGEDEAVRYGMGVRYLE